MHCYAMLLRFFKCVVGCIMFDFFYKIEAFLENLNKYNCIMFLKNRNNIKK